MFLSMVLDGKLYLHGTLVGYRYKDMSNGWYIDVGKAEIDSLFNGNKNSVCLAQDCNDEIYISNNSYHTVDIDLKAYKGMYMSEEEIEAIQEKRFLKRSIGDKEVSTISVLSAQDAKALKEKVKNMYNKLLRNRKVMGYSIIDNRWHGEELADGCVSFSIRLEDRYDEDSRMYLVAEPMEEILSKEYDCYVSVSIGDKHWYTASVYKENPYRD